MVTSVTLFLSVTLLESGTRNALLGSLLNNTKVYLTPFISTQNHTIAGVSFTSVCTFMHMQEYLQQPTRSLPISYLL